MKLKKIIFGSILASLTVSSFAFHSVTCNKETYVSGVDTWVTFKIEKMSDQNYRATRTTSVSFGGRGDVLEARNETKRSIPLRNCRLTRTSEGKLKNVVCNSTVFTERAGVFSKGEGKVESILQSYLNESGEITDDFAVNQCQIFDRKPTPRCPE